MWLHMTGLYLPSHRSWLCSQPDVMRHRRRLSRGEEAYSAMSTSSTEGDTAEAAGDKPTRHWCHPGGAVSAAGNRGPELQHVREPASTEMQALTTLSGKGGYYTVFPVGLVSTERSQVPSFGLYLWGSGESTINMSDRSVDLSIHSSAMTLVLSVEQYGE